MKEDHFRNKLNPANDSMHLEDVLFETLTINNFKDIAIM